MRSPWSPAAKRALQNLRDFYQDGLAVIEAAEGKTKRQLDPNDVVKIFVRERGRSPDYYWQARKFAETHTKEQFEELCSRRRPDGKPLSPAHVRFLRLVRDKRRRNGLQSCAINEGWSASRLYDKIRQVQAAKGKAGPPFREPESVNEAVVQIGNMTDRWLRWLKVLEPSEEEESEGKITWKDLPEALRKKLKAASRGIRKLDDALKELGQDAAD